MINNIKSKSFLFADSTKIFHKITSREDALIPQCHIKLLEDWSQKWLLHFHPAKCHVLTLGGFETIMHTPLIFVAMRWDTFLKRRTSELFTIIFRGAHINQIKNSKCNRESHSRSFSFVDCEYFTKIFIAFVRSPGVRSVCVTCPTSHLPEYVGEVRCRTTGMFKGLTAHLSDFSLVRLLTCPTAHLSDFSLVRLPTCPTAHLSDFSLVRLPTCPTSHLSDFSLVRLLTCPTSHLSDSPLVRQPTCPTAHLSDSPLVRQPTCPTSHLSDFSLVRLLTCPTSHLSDSPLVRLLTCPTILISWEHDSIH